MPRSRRTFLKDLSIAAGCGAVVSDGPFQLLGRIHAAQLDGDQFSSLSEEAFKAARELGCSYADILMNACRTGTVSVAADRNLVGVKAVNRIALLRHKARSVESFLRTQSESTLRLIRLVMDWSRQEFNRARPFI